VYSIIYPPFLIIQGKWEPTNHDKDRERDKEKGRAMAPEPKRGSDYLIGKWH
jgi:hypothetical protein